MRLKALRQIHVSSVKADALRPGEHFDVSDAAGAALLKKHPAKFQHVGEKSEGAASNNKAINGAPNNKGGAGGQEAPDYEESTVADLRELAEKREIDLGGATKKADIIAALQLADEAAAQA